MRSSPGKVVRLGPLGAPQRGDAALSPLPLSQGEEAAASRPRAAARAARLALAGLLALVLGTRCAWSAEQLVGPPPGVPVPPIVHLGTTRTLYDAALVLAAARGYFTAQGIDAQIVEFPSPEAVVWPVIAGQIDLAPVRPTADVFDALGRPHGAPRIVASAGQARPGQSAAALLLRRDLARQPLLDLRGRSIGADLYGPGGRTVARALERLGVPLERVELVDLLPQQAADALANEQVDAAYVVEPRAAALVAEGLATRWLPVDALAPGEELAVLLGSPNLLAHRAALATRLLVAYLEAMHEYRLAARSPAAHTALLHELAGPLHLDLAVVRTTVVPVAYPPDGAPDMASLAALQEHYLGYGLLGAPADLERAVDLSFLAAAREAGPAARAHTAHD